VMRLSLNNKNLKVKPYILKDIRTSGPIWLTDLNGTILLRNIRPFKEPYPVSFSKLSTFYKCPFQFAFHYHYGIKIPKKLTESAKFGHAIHASAHMITVAQQQIIEEPTKEVVKKAIHTFVEKYEEKGEKLPDKIRTVAVEQIKKLEKVTRNEKKLKTTGIKVMSEFSSSFNMNLGGRQISFFYTLDKIKVDKDQVRIFELKSSRKNIEEIKLQVAFYLWAYEKTYSVKPVSAICIQIGTNKVIYEAFPDDSRNMLLEELVSRFLDTVEENLTFKPNPGYYCKNCPSATYCPAFKGIDEIEIESRKKKVEKKIRSW